MRQPEGHRQNRRLQQEHRRQDGKGCAHQCLRFGRYQRQKLRHIRQIQASQRAIEKRYRHQKHRRTQQVEHHIGHARARPRRAAAMRQQGIGGEQENLEKHEQVEQIPGQERSGKPCQLQLEQGMEMPPLPVRPADCHQQRRHRQRKHQQHHHRRQPIHHQHNAIRSRPGPQRINRHFAGARARQQRQRRQQAKSNGNHSHGPLRRGRQQQHQRRCHEGNQDWQNGKMAQSASSDTSATR